MVGVTGLEPVTLRLSSACSNQLSYTPLKKSRVEGRESKLFRRSRSRLSTLVSRLQTGGAEGIRTPDLQLAKLPLYQLSYSPIFHWRLKISDCGF